MIIRKKIFIAVTIAFFTNSFGANSKIDSGLVAYYPFDGNAEDASGHGNHGFIYGATLTIDRNGRNNNAYNFDGINDYIRVPFSADFDFSGEKQISYGLWAYPRSIRETETMFLSKRAGGCQFFFFAISIGPTGHFSAGLSSSGCWIILENPEISPMNRWYHIFVTVDQDIMQFYFNGKKIDEITIFDTKWDRTHTGDVYIGIEYPDPEEGWVDWVDGIIDEVRIYNRALTEQEVELLYQVQR